MYRPEEDHPSEDEKSEEQLKADIARGVAQGNLEQAFVAFVSRYQDDILRFCVHVLEDKSKGEDVSQEVFIAAYKSMLSGICPDKPRSWLFGIARNQIRKLLRDSKRRENILDKNRRSIISYMYNTDDNFSEEQLELLQRGLEQIDEDTRMLIFMRQLNVPYSEIANLFGSSEDAIRQRYSRALRKLLESIAKLS